jgi:phenylacetate-CoA ligase
MWKNSPFMRAKMEGNEILKTGMVKKPEDIVKLPFISGADLAASQRQDPPYGNICSAKAGPVVDIGVNGEASAAPRYFFTAGADLAYTYRYVRPLLTAGVTGDDVVVLLGEDDFWAVNPLCEVLKYDFGCTVICVAYLDAKRRMEAITQLKATVLIGTPSQAQSLADAAGVFGMDAAQTAVRLIITGGEAGIGSSPEIGGAIEQAWNAKAYEFYGCQDVGILAWSCDAGEGLHLMEDDYIFEILDPATGQPVATGAEGELVVTPLLNMTVPVTRYRTGDIVSVIGLPCTCHRTMTRIAIKRKLAEEPASPVEEPPQQEDVEPEPELVAVGAGVKEQEAEAGADEAGSELDTGYEEPGEFEEDPHPSPESEPEVTGDRR